MNLPYKRAADTFNKNDYQKAIIQLDEYINSNAGNPALKVKAQEVRSQCYYELGLEEMGQGNYKQAADFFFLANSDAADEWLDDCYYHLTNEALKKGEFELAYAYLNFVIDNLWNSEYTDNMLFKRLKIEFENQNEPKKSYETYRVLYSNFPHSQYVDSANVTVNEYMPVFIAEARNKLEDGKPEETLEDLFYYLEYPADYKPEIEELIGNAYFAVGERSMQQGKIKEAEKNFKLSIEFNPQLFEPVEEHLNEICSIYIRNGDRLLQERKVEEAIAEYQATFSIIQDYELAKEKIERAQEIAQRIQRAEQLTAQGDRLFQNEEYREAMKLYQEAYQIDPIPIIEEKINNAYRWSRIIDDPEEYAIDIVKGYRNRIIPKRIAAIEEEIMAKFPAEEITVTPWQSLRAVSRNTYEVRYTIITPEKNYFFLWLVRLETGEIVPLNTTTEELMQ
jgi:hypothetical protein